MDKLDQQSAIACTLNDTQFSQRRALARSTIIPQILTYQRIENGFLCSFEQSDELRRNLDNFIRLERQCCGFLSFEILDRDHSDLTGPVTLRITGPKEASDTIEIFIDGMQGAKHDDGTIKE